VTLAVIPDVLGAMRAFLLASPQVASLWPGGSAQVAANVVPDSVKIGSRLVLFRPGGGLGAFDDFQLAQPRFDFFFHGPTPYEAGLVYRTVHPVLVGSPGDHVASGFIQSVSGQRVSVASIVQETGPQMLPALPSGENWPAYYAAYRVIHLEVPVP
jgi:hypothetical protein